MKKNTSGTPLPLEADARVTRFGLRVAAGLTEHSETLSGDIQERLRFARDWLHRTGFEAIGRRCTISA